MFCKAKQNPAMVYTKIINISIMYGLVDYSVIPVCAVRRCICMCIFSMCVYVKEPLVMLCPGPMVMIIHNKFKFKTFICL